MVSHKKFGGIELSLGAGGLRFKKRASAFNVCVGKAMKDKNYTDRASVRGAFRTAAKSCEGTRSS